MIAAVGRTEGTTVALFDGRVDDSGLSRQRSMFRQWWTLGFGLGMGTSDTTAYDGYSGHGSPCRCHYGRLVLQSGVGKSTTVVVSPNSSIGSAKTPSPPAPPIKRQERRRMPSQADAVDSIRETVSSALQTLLVGCSNFWSTDGRDCSAATTATITTARVRTIAVASGTQEIESKRVRLYRIASFYQDTVRRLRLTM